ncbi:hypothetical protein ACGGZK_15310 [Agromyces sp. MMS24-K17]|uniref:hypothetical protein n=1 Tax=Agromyces sp. MMS24-K17 TaxID=3372850 RepID=UPI003754D72E
MSTATLSPGAGRLAGLAVRSGLGLAGWGLRRATRRTDPDRVLGRAESRRIAEAALAERDALIRSAGYLPL